MTSLFGRIVLIALFVVAAMAMLAESRRAGAAADLHQRLLTLDDAEDLPMDESTDPWWRMGPLADASRSSQSDRAIMAYWQPDYRSLVDPEGLAELGGPRATTQPDVLFLAANAAFRSVPTRDVERALTVERLDRVIDQYGDVLRLAPGHADAAYNFEYVTRVRDQIARGRPGRTSPAPPLMPPVESPDLPTGTTVHGRPGGPPPEIPGNDFRTLAPMPYDEREESDPGQGPAPRRRG
jgi:hypothetical protein